MSDDVKSVLDRMLGSGPMFDDNVDFTRQHSLEWADKACDLAEDAKEYADFMAEQVREDPTFFRVIDHKYQFPRWCELTGRDPRGVRQNENAQ